MRCFGIESAFVCGTEQNMLWQRTENCCTFCFFFLLFTIHLFPNGWGMLCFSWFSPVLLPRSLSVSLIKQFICGVSRGFSRNVDIFSRSMHQNYGGKINWTPFSHKYNLFDQLLFFSLHFHSTSGARLFYGVVYMSDVKNCAKGSFELPLIRRNSHMWNLRSFLFNGNQQQSSAHLQILFSWTTFPLDCSLFYSIVRNQWIGPIPHNTNDSTYKIIIDRFR